MDTLNVKKLGHRVCGKISSFIFPILKYNKINLI